MRFCLGGIPRILQAILSRVYTRLHRVIPKNGWLGETMTYKLDFIPPFVSCWYECAVSR